jgi:hypothetical protein
MEVTAGRRQETSELVSVFHGDICPSDQLGDFLQFIFYRAPEIFVYLINLTDRSLLKSQLLMTDL